MAFSSHEDDENTRPSKLCDLFQYASIDEAEEVVKCGLEKMAKLRNILSKSSSGATEFTHWTDQITAITTQATSKQAMVGVIGNTGAGKTSLINAILEQDQFLPTSSMEACTATITELSYSPLPVPYAAEIEFITRDEWKRELELGFQILINSDGRIATETTSANTDVGVFQAKLRAVYPELSREDLNSTSIDSLMDHQNTNVLGSVLKVQEYDPHVFSARLKAVLDSTSHSNIDHDSQSPSSTSHNYWPLIRIVRVLLHSPVLATGVTLVDLPGVQDSNPAREKVTMDYMKRCTGLMTVAPIQRAINDKVAQNLLGQSFKRQLRMDGGLSSVIFVCTKADEIATGKGDTPSSLKDEIDQIENHISTLWQKEEELGEAIEKLEIAAEEADSRLMSIMNNLGTIWSSVQNTNYHPSRPTEHSPLDARLGQSSTNDAESDERPAKRLKIEPFVDAEHRASDQPLSQDDVEGLERQRQELSDQTAEAKRVCRGKKTELNRVKQDLKDSLSLKHAKFIINRNEFVRSRMRKDFKAEFKDLEASDESSNNVETDLNRSAHKVKYVDEDLPVFCVSSQAFLKMSGRLGKDKSFHGFTTIEETGVPQLQEHCKQLMHESRVKCANYFFASFSGLLHSVWFCLHSESSSLSSTETQRAALKDLLVTQLESLKQKSLNNLASAFDKLEDRFKKHLYKLFDTAQSQATFKAKATVGNWGHIHVSTYRAICGKKGEFNNSQGKHDWNEELVELILQIVTPHWERFLTEDTGTALHELSTLCYKDIEEFHESIPKLLEKEGLKLPQNYSNLHAQRKWVEQSFERFEDHGKQSIKAEQRTISREFKPVIRHRMLPAYEACQKETGHGSWLRMKTVMARHMSENSDIFKESVDTVREKLDKLLTDLRKTMRGKICDFHKDISEKYMSALVGHDIIAQEKNRKLRSALLTFFAEVQEDGLFAAPDYPERKMEKEADKSLSQTPVKVKAHETKVKVESNETLVKVKVEANDVIHESWASLPTVKKECQLNGDDEDDDGDGDDEDDEGDGDDEDDDGGEDDEDEYSEFGSTGPCE